METLRELKQKRFNAKADLKAFSDTCTNWTPEAKAKVDAAIKAIDALDVQIHGLELVQDAVRTDLRAGLGQGSISAASMANMAVFAAYLRRGDTAGVQAGMTEAGDGAIMTPYYVESDIMRQAQPYTPLLGYCNIIQVKTTASRATIPVSTTGAATAWVGESSARPETTVPNLEAVTAPDAEIYLSMLLSQWLDEDTALFSFLLSEAAAGIGRALGHAILFGNSTNQPQGILTAPQAATKDGVRAFGAIQTVKSGSGTAILSDALVSMQFSLQPEYRTGAVWVCNSATLAAIRQLKDSSGRYLWEPSLAPGAPSMLLGHEVVEANDMPDIAQDNIALMFGNIKRGYTVLDRASSMLRDIYTAVPHIKLYVRKRITGVVTDACAIKLMKIGA